MPISLDDYYAFIINLLLLLSTKNERKKLPISKLDFIVRRQ